MAGKDKPVLGYWNIRGLVQPSRFLLEHAGADYEDRTFDVHAQDQWFKDAKFTLGLDFPNLPFYIDGSAKVTQSMAILRVLGRKHGMAPRTEEEYARVDMASMQATDLWNEFDKLCYGDNFEKEKPAYLEGLPKKLLVWDKFLGDDDWFGAGEGPTFVDFQIYEVLWQLRKFVPNCLDGCNKLLNFLERVESLPRIAEYMKSDRYISGPIWSPQANWEG